MLCHYIWGESVATLSDVAQSAGVSITAASLVLSDAAGATRISESTARRIREKARELGYHPNAAARRLARRKSDLVGVLAETFSYTIALRRLEATIRALLDNGYQPLVWAADWSESKWQYAHGILASNGVAGALILGPTDPTSKMEIARRLMDADIPTVSFDAGDGLAGAGVDRRGSFHDLTRAAISAGHTKIGYLEPGAGKSVDTLRVDGIEAAIAECDGDVSLVSLRPFAAADSPSPPARSARELGFQTGHLGADMFLANDDPPSAVICHCDDVAIAFMHRIQSAGLRVPDDVAVFGFDGLPESSCTYPPLTTVEQPVDEVSTAAVASLLGFIDDTDTASEDYRLFPGSLIVRESSGGISGAPYASGQLRDRRRGGELMSAQ
ncbi:MAG: LacI family DNA-binding transcriptional regulator [Armatimonadota bacterium]